MNFWNEVKYKYASHEWLKAMGYFFTCIGLAAAADQHLERN